MAHSCQGWCRKIIYRYKTICLRRARTSRFPKTPVWNARLLVLVVVLDLSLGAVFMKQFEDENEDENDYESCSNGSSFIIAGPLPSASNRCTSFDNIPTIRNSISFPPCT